RKSDALLESFEEYPVRLYQTFHEQNTSASGSADTAASSILIAAQEAAPDLQAIRQEMETNFASSMGGYQKQLAELAGLGLERLEQKSVALVAGFQGQLQNTLEGFQQKGTREVADQLQKIAAELQQQSTGQLQEQANDTVKRLSDELRVSGAVLLDNAREGLLGLTQASLKSLAEEAQGIAGSALAAVNSVDRAAEDSIRRAAQQAATEFEAAHREMESRFELGGAEYEKRLTELAASGLKGLQSKSDSLVKTLEEQRDQLTQTFGHQNASLSGGA